MYKCAKPLMYLAFFVVMPTLLSACGGAPTEDTSSQPNNITNEPEVSGTSSSVKTSGSPTSALTSSAPTLSSQAISSAQSFVSASNASSSTVSQAVTGLETTASTPIQLQLYSLTETSITLTWDEATGVSHYDISRNGEFVARVDAPSHMLVDQGLAPYTNYNYTITAFDLTSKESAKSQTFALRTLAASIGMTAKSSPSVQAARGISSVSSISNSRTKSSLSSKSTSSAKSNLSSKSSSSSKASISSKSSSSIGQKPVTISWSPPNQRENGTFLSLDEIGGYEIRYREPTGTLYTYVTLEGSRTTEYTFPKETQDWEFEIAVFDKSGIYSRFVKVNR